jgi:RNase P subunit RPR2
VEGKERSRDFNLHREGVDEVDCWKKRTKKRFINIYKRAFCAQLRVEFVPKFNDSIRGAI